MSDGAHTVRVYRKERYSDEYQATSFVVKEGVLIIGRNGIMLATYAPGDWRSFVDVTQIDEFAQADKVQV